MPNYILNAQSVLLCPHGGVVTHVPVTYTSYRVQGYPPLLFTDEYLISGCPMTGPMGGCFRVQWVNPSARMMIKGIPVLTNVSTGICMTSTGMASGPVMIGSFQTFFEEPNDFKNIDQ